MGAENLTPTTIQSLARPVHSKLLHQLRYPSPLKYEVHDEINSGNACYYSVLKMFPSIHIPKQQITRQSLYLRHVNFE
jgi:hypothetical protein